MVQNIFDKQICKPPCLRWFIFSPCDCLFLVYFRCFIFSLSVVVFHQFSFTYCCLAGLQSADPSERDKGCEKTNRWHQWTGRKSLVCDGCAHTYHCVCVWMYAYVCVGERMQIFTVNAQCKLRNSRNVATHTCNGTHWTKWPQACSLKPSTLMCVRARPAHARAQPEFHEPANACLQALAHRPRYMCRATQMQNNWETDAHTRHTPLYPTCTPHSNCSFVILTSLATHHVPDFSCYTSRSWWSLIFSVITVVIGSPFSQTSTKNFSTDLLLFLLFCCTCFINLIRRIDIWGCKLML